MSRARIYCVYDIFGGEGQDAFEFMYISIQYWARNALLLRMIVRAGLHVRVCRHKTSDVDLHLRMNVVAPSLFQIGVLFPQQPSRHFPSSTFSLICGAFIPNLRPNHKRQGLSAKDIQSGSCTHHYCLQSRVWTFWLVEHVPRTAFTETSNYFQIFNQPQNLPASCLPSIPLSHVHCTSSP